MSANAKSVIDAVMEFRRAMGQAGVITTDEIIPADRFRRFHVDGTRRGKQDGSYWLRMEPWPHGYFKAHNLGISGTWSAPLPKKLTKEERAEYETREREAKAACQAELEKQYAAAQAEAERIWKSATPAPADHLYLKRNRSARTERGFMRENLLCRSAMRTARFTACNHFSGRREALPGRRACWRVHV